MPALAPLLTRQDLPEAELHAARLDGELYAVDECFAALDEPDRPWLRARALRLQFGERTLVGDSALWVHGARHSPPAQHHALQRRLGAAPLLGRLVVHEGALPAADLSLLAGLRVATAARAAVDLARCRTRDPVALAHLLARGVASARDCLAAIERAPRMPGSSRARRLFERMPPGPAQPALTR